MDVIIAQNEKSQHDGSRSGTWSDVFQHRNSMIIGCGLMAIHVLVGVNAVSSVVVLSGVELLYGRV